MLQFSIRLPSSATHRKLSDMKGKSGTQGKGFAYVVAVPIAVLLIVAATTVYDYRNGPIKRAHAVAGTETHSAEPFCAFEGVWHDWEDDEVVTLGCLEVKGNVREGSYSSATGPRATFNFQMTGTYDLDSDDSILVFGKTREGMRLKFSKAIYVNDTEYPTQMIAFNKNGERVTYIWKRIAAGQ